MKTIVTVQRLAFALGLLAATAGSRANSAEPKAEDAIENSTKMKLVYIPPGAFEMGSPESEDQRSDREKLHHARRYHRHRLLWPDR